MGIAEAGHEKKILPLHPFQNPVNAPVCFDLFLNVKKNHGSPSFHATCHVFEFIIFGFVFVLFMFICN